MAGPSGTLKTEETVDSLGVEEIRSLITRLVACWNAHDAQGVAAFYHRNFVGTDINQQKPIYGPQAIRRAMEYQLCAFPDLTIEAEDPIVEGNRAAFAWTLRGTHRGKIMSIPATGKRVEYTGVSLVQFRGDKIIESMRNWDVAGMLRALGCLPDL
jgi:steroid delta-isomerase-like uncharacterized protein